MPDDTVVILIVAIILDRFVGDPEYPCHPVRLIGRLINWLEGWLGERMSSPRQISMALPVAAVGCSVLGYSMIESILGGFSFALNLFLTYSLFAWGDLLKHSEQVRSALEKEDLSESRHFVQRIVGRDVSVLDPHGVARATIESIAESLVDGILAPIFWYAVGAILFQSTGGAVACLIGFKVISTLDSMVGYKNEKYIIIGRVSAKIDDLLNLAPARISIPVITAASTLLHENDSGAWRIGCRDRLKHSSPNSAHAEAAMAGALDLSLGGPTQYPHGLVEKPWLGDGRKEAVANDIERAQTITSVSTAIVATIAVILVWSL